MILGKRKYKEVKYNLSLIPEDNLIQIIEFLYIQEQHRLKLVSKYFKSVFDNTINTINTNINISNIPIFRKIVYIPKFTRILRNHKVYSFESHYIFLNSEVIKLLLKYHSSYLRSLEYSGNDCDMKIITKFSNLRKLSLHMVNTETLNNIKSIELLDKLEYFRLAESKLSCKYLKYLPNSIKYLNLRLTNIPEKTPLDLNHLIYLEELTIYYSNITTKNLVDLPKSIKKLKLIWCTKLTSSMFSKIDLPKLEYLDLRGCSRIDIFSLYNRKFDGITIIPPVL